MRTAQATLSRTATRLLVAADDQPRSLDDLQARAGYSNNDGRPIYRRHADALVLAGLFAAHAPYRTGKYPRYSRTAAGNAAVAPALAERPALRPLTPIDPEKGRPAPLPADLSEVAARLLLAFASGSQLTLSKAIEKAGYAGDVTSWFRQHFRQLTVPLYVVAELDLEDVAASVYRITPAGRALAEKILAVAPPLPAPDEGVNA